MQMLQITLQSKTTCGTNLETQALGLSILDSPPRSNIELMILHIYMLYSMTGIAKLFTLEGTLLIPLHFTELAHYNLNGVFCS